MIKGQSEKKHWQWQPLLAIICCYDCGSVTHKKNAKASQFSEPEYYLQGEFSLLCVFSLFASYPVNFDAAAT